MVWFVIGLGLVLFGFKGILWLLGEHVNWQTKTITFYDTKNGDNRIVALSETAFLILKTLPVSVSGFLFPLKNRDHLNWHWQQALKKAEIDDFVFHDLRRTGITWLFEYKNLSVPEVQSMSGHRDRDWETTY